MDAPLPIDGFEPGSNETSKAPHWFALLVPIVIAVAVSFLSPNFQLRSNVATANEDMISGVPQRNSSVGADFLQEYVGGFIFGSADRAKLYDPEHFQAMEHDAELLGFQWPNREYFPMVYPPFYYAATSVLSSLGESGIGYVWTARLWLWLSGVAISLSGLLLHRFFPPSRSLIASGLIASIAFVPMLHNFNLAQKGSFLLLILSATFVLLHHNKKLSAGIVFGLIAFKPHLGLTIGLIMLIKRQWRFCWGAVVMVSLLTGVSFWAAPSLWHDYIEVVLSMQDYVGNAGYELAESHSFWGALELSLGEIAPALVKPLALIASVGLVVFLLRATWTNVPTDSDAFALQYSAMVIAMVMLSPHFYTYDLTILLLPLCLIVSSMPGAGSGEPSEVGSRTATETTRPKFDRAFCYALLALFALAGLFPKIAAVIGIQLSIPLMLYVLLRLFNRPKLGAFVSGEIATGR